MKDLRDRVAVVTEAASGIGPIRRPRPYAFTDDPSIEGVRRRRATILAAREVVVDA